MNRPEILKELANLKIKYWELADNTHKLYTKKREALSNFQQHIREKKAVEAEIIELRIKKEKIK